MRTWTFQEWMGLILSVGIIAMLNLLAWHKVLDPQFVAGAEIGWVGMIIGFFYRKAKRPDIQNGSNGQGNGLKPPNSLSNPTLPDKPLS